MLTGAEMLAVAFGIFALIWIAVIWGSRYFGPEHD